jgi:hypothetical protein
VRDGLTVKRQVIATAGTSGTNEKSNDAFSLRFLAFPLGPWVPPWLMPRVSGKSLKGLRQTKVLYFQRRNPDAS